MIKHIHDHTGSHWLELEEDGKLIRGRRVPYDAVAQLRAYCAVTDYYDKKLPEVFVATPVEFTAECCVTDRDDSEDWRTTWWAETEAALNRATLEDK